MEYRHCFIPLRSVNFQRLSVGRAQCSNERGHMIFTPASMRVGGYTIGALLKRQAGRGSQGLAMNSGPKPPIRKRRAAAVTLTPTRTSTASTLASRLDQEADAELFAGRRLRAEYLAHRAAKLREVAL